LSFSVVVVERGQQCEVTVLALAVNDATLMLTQAGELGVAGASACASAPYSAALV
jgi:hypothetical protein